MAEDRLCGEVVGEDFDEIFHNVIYYLLKHPEYEVSPRGSKIREIIAPTLILMDPRSRLIYNPARKANYGFAVGEFLWYMRGSNDLESISYYNKRMKNYSDDGKRVNSAYGYLMNTGWNKSGRAPFSQFVRAMETLIQDPDSRRSVIQIHQPWHQADPESKDVPCTLSMQFFVRQNMLHLHVNMRSNDVIWGLTNDLFSFTLFQELALLVLKEWEPEKFKNLRLGHYYHTAGSLHLYEHHFKLAEEILATSKELGLREAMKPLESMDKLEGLLKDESLLRSKEIVSIDLDRYSGIERWMAERLNEHRQKRDTEEKDAGLQRQAEGHQRAGEGG